MPRLFAPEGVTSFSHAGHSFEVGADGSVAVSEHVAKDLLAHGFTPEPEAPSETVVVKRADLLAALEKLGSAASPAMDGKKLAAVLSQAVAKDAKPGKPTLTLGDKGKSAPAT